MRGIFLSRYFSLLVCLLTVHVRNLWRNPGTSALSSGKISEVPGKVFPRLSQLADGSFVAGIILVLE
jgi:hypothetical protein